MVKSLKQLTMNALHPSNRRLLHLTTNGPPRSAKAWMGYLRNLHSLGSYEASNLLRTYGASTDAEKKNLADSLKRYMNTTPNEVRRRLIPASLSVNKILMNYKKLNNTGKKLDYYNKKIKAFHTKGRTANKLITQKIQLLDKAIDMYSEIHPKTVEAKIAIKRAIPFASTIKKYRSHQFYNVPDNKSVLEQLYKNQPIMKNTHSRIPDIHKNAAKVILKHWRLH